MKEAVRICAVLLAMAGCSYSQLVLTPGQTWTYEFSSLPFRGSTNAFLTTVHGEFGFTVNSASLQTGDALGYQMFENNIAESPICSGMLMAGDPNSTICSSPQAWQDFQGAVRFQMLVGSVTVDNVTLRSITPSPSLSSYFVYESSFTPVPEPATWRLLCVSLGAGLLVQWRIGVKTKRTAE